MKKLSTPYLTLVVFDNTQTRDAGIMSWIVSEKQITADEGQGQGHPAWNTGLTKETVINHHKPVYENDVS